MLPSKVTHQSGLVAHPGKEAGFYAVLMSAMAFVLVLAFASFIGMGFFSSGAAKLQTVSDLVSNAALNAFVSSDSTDYQTRANEALTALNQTLSKNSITGKSVSAAVAHAGEQSEGSAGIVEFGNWYRHALEGGSDYCGEIEKNYPCFVPNPWPPEANNSPEANAVRLTLSTGETSWSNFALCELIGGCGKKIHTTSISTIVPRCVVAMADVSPSSHFHTHTFGFAVPATPPSGNACLASHMDSSCTDLDCLWCQVPKCRGADNSVGTSDDIYYCLVNSQDLSDVPQYSRPFYRYAATRDALDASGSNEIDCSNKLSYHNSWESVYWCNMPSQRDSTPAEPFNLTRHYQSDYIKRTVQYKDALDQVQSLDLMVDSITVPDSEYIGPQPLADIMLGINAAFRSLNTVLSHSDAGAFIAFSGTIKGGFPFVDGAERVTSEFGTLIQVTNMENRGTREATYEPDGSVTISNGHGEIRPNFLDAGAYPLDTFDSPDNGKSNLSLVLAAALDTMQSCKPESRKILILGSDMVSNCSLKDSALLGSLDSSDYDCPDTNEDAYAAYKDTKSQLLAGSNSMLELFKSLGIAVVVLQGGDFLGLNIRNVQNNNPSPHFLGYLEAVALGYGGAYMAGYPNTNENLLYADISPVLPNDTSGLTIDEQNELAFSSMRKPGVYFRDPIGVGLDLAALSGGVYAPMMRVCPEDSYGPDGQILDGCRNGLLDCDGDGDPNYLSCSPVFLSPGAQAVQAVLESVAGDPYVQVAEEEIPAKNPTPYPTINTTPPPTAAPTDLPTPVPTVEPTKTHTPAATATSVATSIPTKALFTPEIIPINETPIYVTPIAIIPPKVK